MWKRIAWLLPLFAVALALARDKPENWLEVRSQHFTVVTNANEKTGRRMADQFERMRSVFHVAFPHLSVDTGSPITVLAIKDEKDFRVLLPPASLAKGQLKLGGLFLRAADKSYVLLRVDAEGDHPYAVVYHEYTHSILSQAADWLPLWLNEGLAEFYQNTDIHEKEVALGQSSPENLQLLRENRLLPLATLFTVDVSSPYYHEENKGSIFYAQSWALTHYLEVSDHQEKTQHLTDYLQLLAQKVDPVTAATRAFGDLTQLQSKLEAYIRQGTYSYFRLATSTGVDDTAFQVRAVSTAQADAVRADFLAYNERGSDARALLERVLRDDPQNVLAHETMGFLEFRAGHAAEARKWYEQAVKLDSQSYLAHYYFASISMSSEASPEDDAQVERSLRAAIKLNPSFAPAYDRLAVFEGNQRRNLDEAHRMALTAVQLDPGNVAYRVNSASVLIQMQRAKDAADVLRAALRVAKSPAETAMVQNALMHAEAFANALELEKEQDRRLEEEREANAKADAAAAEDERAEIPEQELLKRPHHFLVGRLQNVHCRDPRLDLTVATDSKTLLLHSRNYYKIAFTVLGFTPKGTLNPCKDLEGMTAKIEYVEIPGKPAATHVVAIELRK